jgi:FeS assembly SUF system regulator
MIKINKITDYGLVLLTHFANQNEQPQAVWTARELAEVTQLPRPMVGKILKILSRAEILDSLRGSSGGYVLKKDPKGLRVNTILEALEGPSRITDCDEIGAETCSIQKQCPTKNHWQKINRKFHEALGELTLQDLSNRSDNGA